MCTCSGLCRGTKWLFFLLLGNPFGERQRVHNPFLFQDLAPKEDYVS